MGGGSKKRHICTSQSVSETQPSAPFLTGDSATPSLTQTIGGQIRLFAIFNTVSESEAPAVRVGARVGGRSS